MSETINRNDYVVRGAQVKCSGCENPSKYITFYPRDKRLTMETNTLATEADISPTDNFGGEKEKGNFKWFIMCKNLLGDCNPKFAPSWFEESDTIQYADTNEFNTSLNQYRQKYKEAVECVYSYINSCWNDFLIETSKEKHHWWEGKKKSKYEQELEYKTELEKELKCRFGTTRKLEVMRNEMYRENQSLENAPQSLSNLEDLLNIYEKHAPSEAVKTEAKKAKKAIGKAVEFLENVENSKQNLNLHKAILMGSLLICTRGGGVLSFQKNGVRESTLIGEYTYNDDKGNTYTYIWEITDEIFRDSYALTQEQITMICNAHNPELIEKKFDVALYDACQYYELNPKVMLATLKWEQSWGKVDINKAFGVDAGHGGNPITFSPNQQGGLMLAAQIYDKYFTIAKESYVGGENTLSQTYGKDPAPYNESGVRDYVSENSSSANYFEEGQTLTPVNAAMYARGKYTPWLYYPPHDQHSTKVWHNTVMYEIDNELEALGQ